MEDDTTEIILARRIKELEKIILRIEKSFTASLAKVKETGADKKIESVATSLSKELKNAVESLKNSDQTLEKSLKSYASCLSNEVKKDFYKNITSLSEKNQKSRREIESLISESVKELKNPQKDFEKKLQSIHKEFDGRIIDILNKTRGGGGLNRQMFINGIDPLTRYTDMNLKAGSNVTITYQNNDSTKKVDVTFSATGGSGSGIVRSINSVSTATNAGSSTTTDYVYLCSGTMTLTMPDATAGNSNLYTVKNVGSGIITIATTSAQTIDGSTSITLPVQYTSVDLESDGSNWNVT